MLVILMVFYCLMRSLTPFGRWLRSTSVDELPELINVLRGEMSFIGHSTSLNAIFTSLFAYAGRRHEVKPGLSGLAQINGRNAISWEEKFHMDVCGSSELLARYTYLHAYHFKSYTS